MKGVSRARARYPDAEKPGGGSQRCGPLLAYRGVFGYGARAPIDRLAVVAGRIVHSSLKSDENVCKTPDIG